MNEIDQHNRRVMLNRVRTYWLKGVLEESLHGGDMIDLSLAYRPSAVAGSHEPSWQQTAEYDIPLPFGTTISTVFAAAGGELLILGEPGAGKTTMLLQLVSDLLAVADEDERQPIPVVFSLASWNPGKSLDQWLVEELSNNYEVPRQIGREWIDQKRFIPLLDGLDEVENERRIECAEAINTFRRSYPGVQMLVTTRSKDYLDLQTRLQLEKAIMLQPLRPEQIDQYLSSRGQRLVGLRSALDKDATLRELAQTPLMLSIMTLAYYRMPAEVALSLGEQEIGRKLLFDVYVERMSRYRGGDKEYDPQDTVHWLSWLASMLGSRNRTMFFLENMQPTWLGSEELKRLTTSLKTIILLLCLAAGLIGGLLSLPAYGLPGLVGGSLLGLLVGGITVVSGRLLLRGKTTWDRIETIETLGWSWSWGWLSLAVGIVSGLLIGVMMTLIDRLGSGSTGVPWWLIMPIFVSGGFILDRAVLRSEVKIRTTPGLGIQRSRQNGLVVGTAAALGTTIAAFLLLTAASLAGLPVHWEATLPWIVCGGLLLGIMGGLLHGGLATLKYYRLQAALERLNAIPEGYVRFLDYAAERSMLRKVGGGYTFMHALLLDYFKGRYTSAWGMASHNISPLQS